MNHRLKSKIGNCNRGNRNQNWVRQKGTKTMTSEDSQERFVSLIVGLERLMDGTENCVEQ